MNKIEVVCIVIGAIATVLGGVWFIIVRTTKSGIKKYRLSRAESELSSLPCKEHDVSLLAHTQVIGNIESTLKEDNSMLVELSKWVMKMDESMIERLAKKESPLRMTEAGEYLFNKSGGGGIKLRDLYLNTHGMAGD